jgi:predicted TIM-barrel fold metal-dependent hydrolase
MATEGIMPTGDADWLALTPEPTLEPELPICDAHHHLWEFRPEPVPYQRYLLAELAEDLGSGHNVRATVFIEYCIEQFGPRRCMFESNFPVDKVSYSYNVLYNAFKRLSQGYSPAERAALFHDTAARVYRLAV